MMNLGIITGWNSEEDFRTPASYGLHRIEMCYNGGNDPLKLQERLCEIKGYLKKYDLSVGSIGRWGTKKYLDDGTPDLRELENNLTLIDICKELGCPVFVTGCNYAEALGYEQNVENAVEYFTRITERAGDSVKVAVYNCDWDNFVRDPKTWADVLDRVPGLGIKYDASHCINAGSGDYLGELADWCDRVYHVHVKGTINIRGKHIDDPPAGLGQINWHALTGILRNHNYNGMLSIEPHSGLWRGALGKWGIRYTINYITPMLTEHNN